MDLETKIDATAAYEHVKALTELTRKYVGKCGRLAATPGEHEAVRYIKEKLENLNIDVCKAPVAGIRAWEEIESSVKIIQPIREELTCCAVPGSASTPEEGIVGELVYVGRGFEKDYEGLNLAGKIVMHDPPIIRRTDNPIWYSVAELPIKMGAAGMVEYARIPGRVLQEQTAEAQGSSIPIVTVVYEDGIRLKELLHQWYATHSGKFVHEKIPVKVKIRVKANSSDGTAYNVIGSIKGSRWSNEKIVVVAHHDGVHISPAANDNSSSLAVLIEIAGALSKLDSPKRSIDFVSVTGEEYGYVGARNYLGQSKEAVKACIAMDLVGGGNKLYIITGNQYEDKVLHSTKWLDRILFEIAERLGYYVEPNIIGFATDNGPFQAAGIPNSYIGGAGWLSWPFHHSPLDDVEAVEPNLLKVTGDIVATALWRLANAEDIGSFNR